MYKWTAHFIKGDIGDIQSPGPDWFLKSVVYASPERIVCVWEQSYGWEDGWGESRTTTWRDEVHERDPFLERDFTAQKALNDPVSISGCA